MLFHPKKRYVFIATPKTGTTSIEDRIQDIDADVLRDFMVDEAGETRRVRRHISALQARRMLGRHAREFTFVAFVRSPAEIVASKYFYYRQGEPYQLWREGKLSFFLKNRNWYKPSLTHKVLLARALRITTWASVYPLKLNYHFLVDDAGDLMVDEIGRYSSLQQDFERIFSQFGYSRDQLRLPRKNVTRYSISNREKAAIDAIARRRAASDFDLYESLYRQDA